MHQARLIVSERTGRWASALRRELADQIKLGGQEVVLSESRSLADCDRQLDRWPASLVAVEVDADSVDRVLSWLASLERHRAAARCVVLVERGLGACHSALQEAGAQVVVDSPRRLAPVARIAAKHLSQLPQSSGNLTERILAELPWGDWAARATGD